MHHTRRQSDWRASPQAVRAVEPDSVSYGTEAHFRPSPAPAATLAARAAEAKPVNRQIRPRFQ